jgi:predicted ATPase/DNA-binding XRE family transcriptional regulator
MSESLGTTRSDTTAFGAALRSMRLAAGLSQAALAERAGLSEKAVGALERGDRTTPRPATIVLLAQAVGASPAQRDRLLAAARAEQRPTDIDAASVARHGLLVPPTPLLGRQQDIAAVSQLISPSGGAARLVTLIGPGGVGKTRVALAVALQLVDAFADNVWFVDLSPLRDYRLVAASVARALDVRESGGRSAHELLIDALRERVVLLVLDNFEHVLDAAPLVADLLSKCPRLSVLVTSRTPLRLRAERRFIVEPLSVPRANGPHTLETITTSPAVQLFVDRAQAIVPDFALTPSNANALGAICSRLDGLPLAIELAAARVPLLSPNALLRRLERPFPELSAGTRDLPSRHQTLYNTLAWSYELLGPAEQALFRRLAVFAGGWTLEAAEAVCGGTDLPSEAVLEHLDQLVESSLVLVLDAGRDERRFGLLEIVREYAEGQLINSGEAPTMRARHCDWYVAWAERVLPELTRPSQTIWYQRLDDELANLRAARAWCRAQVDGSEAELRLAAALGRYWWVRAPGAEGPAWLNDALAQHAPTPAAAWARALTWSGQFEYLYGDPELGRQRLEQAVAVARGIDEPSLLSMTVRHLALYCAEQPDAVALLEEAVAIAGAAGDQRELAFGLSYLAGAYDWQGEVAKADAVSARALAAGRACGDATALAEVLLRAADRQVAAGRLDTAAAVLHEALAASQTLGVYYLVSITAQLAWLALAQRDLAEARARVTASLELARLSGIGADSLLLLRVAAQLAVALGRDREGARLSAAVAAWEQRYELPQDSTLWTHTLWTRQRLSLAREPDALGRAPPHDAAQESEAFPVEAEPLSLPDALDAALAACQE